MKTKRHQIARVFFFHLLTLSALFMSSCTSDCPGENVYLTIENQWNRPIYVEVISGDYVTHNASLDEGEEITVRVNQSQIEVRTREKGFLLFPDRTQLSFEAQGCWDYEVIAYANPNNFDSHYLETNQTPQ
jgi:hypothetical protein